MTPALRKALSQAALRMAEAVSLESLCTFEFLVEASGEFAFIEANPRLQVEHTVTEAVTGVDLVRAQLAVGQGQTLRELDLDETPATRGHAMQARVNLERMQEDGSVLPSGGTLDAFDVPTGPGVRVDTLGYTGYATSPRYDSLLAKVIAHTPGGTYGDVVGRCRRALAGFRIEGAETNRAFLQALLAHPEVEANRVDTRFVEARAEELLATLPSAAEPGRAPALAGARVATDDPLAVLAHGKAEAAETPASASAAAPDGAVPVEAPLQGTVVSLDVAAGEGVRAGQPLLVMEAMKMEHVVVAPCSGYVLELPIAVGDAVFAGHALVFLEPAEIAGDDAAEDRGPDLDRIRPDLAEVHERHAIGQDERRPEAVARRRKTGQRTARENVDDLCDAESFVEYGPLVIAAQRRRRSVEDLVARTPADGMLAGIGTVNAEQFGDEAARTMVLSYDYTVLAGTQGQQNHRKKDRMFELAERWRLPLVFFTEGGGGRPGDTDGLGVAGLDCWAFHYFGRLSGLVPLVGINSGRCFAGNAALLGCCDVVIATARTRTSAWAGRR